MNESRNYEYARDVAMLQESMKATSARLAEAMSSLEAWGLTFDVRMVLPTTDEAALVTIEGRYPSGRGRKYVITEAEVFQWNEDPYGMINTVADFFYESLIKQQIVGSIDTKVIKAMALVVKMKQGASL